MSGFIVPDASVALKWYLPEPLAEEAFAWLQRMKDRQAALAAPDLLLYEVGQVLRKHVRAHGLRPGTAESILTHIIHSPIRFVEAGVIAADALRKARAYGITVYDASYVALAEALNTQVVTADGRLVRALAPTPLGHRVVALETALET